MKRRLEKRLESRMLFTLVGLVLVLLSWFNPLSFSITIRIILFILGFDMMAILPKIGVFVLNTVFPLGQAFGYLSWTLLLLFAAELMIACTEAYKSYRLIIKPAAVFIVAYLSLGLQLALIAAGIDLLINLTHKIRVGKRYKQRRKGR